jgi:hypothetical protein
MNRVVRENYPVTSLPDDLRDEAEDTATATVIVDIEAPQTARVTFRELFESLHHARVLSDDPVLRVRALREEWDERSRYLAEISRGGSE